MSENRNLHQNEMIKKINYNSLMYTKKNTSHYNKFPMNHIFFMVKIYLFLVDFHKNSDSLYKMSPRRIIKLYPSIILTSVFLLFFFCFSRKQRHFEIIEIRCASVGGSKEFSDTQLPVRHGRRQFVLGKMVQRRSRVLPIHAWTKSQNSRVPFGRSQRRREWSLLSRGRDAYFIRRYFHFRSTDDDGLSNVVFCARRREGVLKITGKLS